MDGSDRWQMPGLILRPSLIPSMCRVYTPIDIIFSEWLKYESIHGICLEITAAFEPIRMIYGYVNKDEYSKIR